MSPLDAREWLEAERLAGNPYAGDLIDLLDNEPAAIECGEAITEIKNQAPKEIRESPDLWRLVEWITDRLALLGEVEEVTAEHSEGLEWSDKVDVAERLRAMLESPRWLTYDL